MMFKKMLIVFVCCASFLLPASPIVWNKSNNFLGWKYFTFMTGKIVGDNLELTNLKFDCRVSNNSVSFDPKEYNAFSFRYRAFGTGKSTGELFFAHEGGGYKHNHYWVIPRLIADGQWHTVTLQPKNQTFWQNGGKITSLRLDPTNSAGGKIEISEIRLEKLPFQETAPAPKKKVPVTRKAAACQLQSDEPDWPVVKSELLKRKEDSGPYFQGKMIQSPQDLPEKNPVHSFYLRRNFVLKEVPVHSWIQFTADDCAEAYINGRHLGFSNDWRTSIIREATPYLTKGKNVLAFHYFNETTAGGVLAELYLQYEDGRVERINTDRNFLCSGKGGENWNKALFDDAKWERPVERPAPPAPPWRIRLPYRYIHNLQTIYSASVSPGTVYNNSPMTFHIEGKGIRPAEDFSITINFNHEGQRIWTEDVVIPIGKMVSMGGNRWKIEFTCRSPRYLKTQHFDLSLTSDFFAIQKSSGNKLSVKYIQRDDDKAFAKAEVTTGTINGETCFLFNGKPYIPLIGGVNAHGLARKDKVCRLNAEPLDLINVNPNPEQWWPSPEKFNSDTFDLIAEKMSRNNPETRFIWNFTLNPPSSWADFHPQEMCIDEKGRRTSNSQYSFYSSQIRRDMKNMIRKCIGYLEKSPYRNRIVGYRICGGTTIEWLGWNTRYAVDFSPCGRRAFAEFAAKYYPELKDRTVPTSSDHRRSDGVSVLRDPQKHLKSIAYFDFYSTSMADLVIELCREARACIGKSKLIGTYFGYISTLHHTGCSQMRAHYALKHFLEKADVDFLMSPNSYPLRDLGYTNGEMKPFRSIQNHGMISLLEDDTRSHSGYDIKSTPGSGSQLITEYQSTNILRRNMGIALCRMEAFYPYALLNGTEWDFPAATADFRKFRKLCRHLEKHFPQRQAEVALVVSENTIRTMPVLYRSVSSGLTRQVYNADGTVKKTPLRRSVLNYETFIGLQSRFARSGAPVDLLLAEDLQNHRKKYKLYVFANCYAYDEQFLKAVDRLREENCTMLWLYAPGYIRDLHMGEENMTRLTGINLKKYPQSAATMVHLQNGKKVGTPNLKVSPLFYAMDQQAEILGRYPDGKAGVVMRRTGKARSIFSGVWQLNMPFVHDIIRRAGVFSYLTGDDPLEANSSLISFHARYPGKKVIQLPKKCDVVDVFAGRLVAKGVTSFQFEAGLHETRLFYIGASGEELLNSLNR